MQSLAACGPSAGCRASSTSSTRSAARQPQPSAAAAVAAARHRQHHQQQLLPAASHAHGHPCRRQQVVARVRLDELTGGSNGAAAAGVQRSAEALQEYMALEQSGNFNAATVTSLRLKYGIRRGDDGRLQLRRADGTWLLAKLDLEMPGIILLRSAADEKVFVLQTERFQQVDLSDDYLAFMLFADEGWEEQLLPIQLADAQGNASVLEMGEQEFKDYVGLIRSLQEASAQAAAQQAAAGGQGAGGGDEDDDGAIDVTAEVTQAGR